MNKIDLRKELKNLYNSTSEVEVVDVPAMNFLKVDGSGDPNKSKQYQDAIEALFSLSYTLKFMIKKSKQSIDYAVMPLEGLWWNDNPDQFSMENKDVWSWTSMIMQPTYVSEASIKEAVEHVRKKKDLVALPKLRFEPYQEGLSAQIMHIGPYTNEKPTIERLHNFINENGYRFNGKHHEIYLNDLRKTKPEKLKTLIRQPIIKKQ